MHNITPHDIFTLAAEVKYASFGDEGIAFDLSTRDVFELNQTALRIMGLLDGANTVETVTQRLGEETQKRPEEIHGDVVRFIGGLLERNWVHVKEKQGVSD
jgi:hypothetical protein